MEKEKEISISSLNIKIGDIEINLSMNEAKKLKSALDYLFGKEVVREYSNNWFYNPYQHYDWSWSKLYCQVNANVQESNNQEVINMASDYTVLKNNQVLCLIIE